MFLFDGSFGDSNESTEAFIGDNLSLYQVRWLQHQAEALRESKAQLLEAILKEWLLNHPEETSRRLERGELARRAMNDFILLHHQEFLPMSSR
jgi:hypothetical protein